MFALMEALFHPSSFSKQKISTQWIPASIPASIHGNWRFNCNSIATQKDGQAMNMGWTGLRDILVPKHASKQQENIVFSFAMDMIVTLLPNSLLIV